MPLRKDSAREGELRIIEIEGFDFSPCGGTHARRTGEVGRVAARHWERARGLVRVTFAAGGRAVEDYRRANRTARAVAALFSTGRDEAAEAAARLQEENKLMLRRLRAAEELAARAEARELVEEAGTIRGVRYQGLTGRHEVRALLTVGADGRFSTLGVRALEACWRADAEVVLSYKMPTYKVGRRH